jgi:hypothetical protein
MTPRETIIDQLMTVKYGSINNFFSITAKDPDGCMLQTSKYFNDFIKHGYIRPLAFDIPPRNRRKEIFYAPTLKGAKYVGREAKYKYKEIRATSTARHDSMKYDIALSFVRLYPDWNFEFEYEKAVGGKKCDIFITARNGLKLLYYWVEIERKTECYKGVNTKVNIFTKAKHKLPFGTKCLFVLAYLYHDPLLRPQEYNLNPMIAKRIETNNKQFNRFVKIAPKGDFLFINFINFYRLNEAVWFDQGSPRKLIQ